MAHIDRIGVMVSQHLGEGVIADCLRFVSSTTEAGELMTDNNTR